MRYRYDAATGRRLKTIELIVDAVPWAAKNRAARRRHDDIVAVRILWKETELRERAKRLGAIWRPLQKLWEMRWEHACALGLRDRVQESKPDTPP